MGEGCGASLVDEDDDGELEEAAGPGVIHGAGLTAPLDVGVGAFPVGEVGFVAGAAGGFVAEEEGAEVDGPSEPAEGCAGPEKGPWVLEVCSEGNGVAEFGEQPKQATVTRCGVQRKERKWVMGSKEELHTESTVTPNARARRTDRGAHWAVVASSAFSLDASRRTLARMTLHWGTALTHRHQRRWTLRVCTRSAPIAVYTVFFPPPNGVNGGS